MTELIPVTDLKQWAYCPRIVYYHRVLGEAGTPTFKMREGVAANDMLERLEARRGLQKFGWEAAEKRFRVWLKDEDLGLCGRLDFVLVRGDEAAVVEFKLTAGDVGDNHRLQMGGYAALLEAGWGVRVESGFFYRIPDDQIWRVDLGGWKERAREAVGAIRVMEREGAIPEATAVRGRCVDCEYANFCGDVW